MTKMKMVFGIMSLIVFIGFLSCEKDQDEITPDEVSTALNSTSVENIAKELHDPFAKWGVYTFAIKTSDFVRNKNQVLETLSEREHPAYRNLLDVRKRKSLEILNAGCITSSRDLCVKLREENQNALAAIKEYEDAGLPQVLPPITYKYIVTREDNNFVYIKDVSRDVEIGLPVYNKPNYLVDGKILVNGEYKPWKRVSYQKSGIITGTINRTTGEYRDIPGRRIKVDYFASPGAPCYEDEELEVRITGDGVYVSIDVDFGGRTAASKGGSRIFIMPASGVVKIRAAIKATNGCSRANIKFNNANKIELGTGGYGERKFP